MKKFADLHIIPPTNITELREMFYQVSTLGFTLIGISINPRIKENLKSSLRKIGKEYGLDIAFRRDLSPRTSSELLKTLRKFRRNYEIISVNCLSKSVSRQAAKDHRVDLLSFPSFNYRRRYFDHAEANLAKQGLAALEINMMPIITLDTQTRTNFLYTLRKEVEIAQKNKIPIIISSKAESLYHLRDPHSLASLATLFGMERQLALTSLSKTPNIIIERNRTKLDSSYVAPGIRIIRRGKDCTG